jgi:ferric-dicitrate binding protein FerR (iron transport regulator)
MKSRKVISVKELIQDESFIQWVKTDTDVSDNYWEEYLKKNPDQQHTIKLASQFVKAIRLNKEYALNQEALDQLKGNIQSEKLHKTDPVKGRNRFIYWGIAASLLLLIISYAGFNYWSLQQNAFGEANLPSLVEKRTEYGQKLTVSLPDGTMVKLNAGSSISYPAEFSGNKREVRFSGEGFFEVAKDTNKPFIIESDGIFTKVLGTSFNLRSYSNEGEINVAVVTGKVEVRQPADTSVLLLPYEMGVFDKSKRQITKQVYDSDVVLVWQDDILNFKKMPLPKVLDELEKWYGVKFVMDEDVRLSGDFSGKFQHSSLEHVLEGIQYTSISKFQFKIEDKKVYLTTE